MEKINSNRTESSISRLRIGKGVKKKLTSDKLNNLIKNPVQSNIVEQVPSNMQYLYTTPINND